MSEFQVVTGAFSYTGKYLTQRLLDAGVDVKTITGHPRRESPFGDRVPAFHFDFDRPERLAETLRGASVLYNTYWIRFDYGEAGYELAVRNTRILFEAARTAGVKRIVHVSIANPSVDSPLPYYVGKAALEEDLKLLGLSWAIIRPTVIFGGEDILVNNIAWFLRRFPVFAMPGDGRYGIQPIFVEDMAELMQRAGADSANTVIDAVGPETYSFEDLVRLIRSTVGSRCRIVHVPPRLLLPLLWLLGRFVRDVVLTPQEIEGLMAGLLVSKNPPTETTKLSDWLRLHADTVGRGYASEVARHFRRGT